MGPPSTTSSVVPRRPACVDSASVICSLSHPEARLGGRVRRGLSARVPRRAAAWLKEQIALAESTQAGLEGATDAVAESGPVAPALAQFRSQVSALLQALPREASER